MLTLSRPLEASPGAPAADHFGRIFARPAAAERTEAYTRALLDLGRIGGLLDARDDPQARPADLVGRPLTSLDEGPAPAGLPFALHFIGHDLRHGAPAFDLESIYGGGPRLSPELYDPVDRGKLRVESGGLFEDVPRGADQRALIGAPSNDENLVLSGLHAAFLLAHNHVLDIMRARRGRSRTGEDVFLQARRVVTWHYQWLVVHELLPALVGQSVVDSVLAYGRRCFVPHRAAVPVEFETIFKAIGASMLRPAYRANLHGDNGQPFVGRIYDPSEHQRADPNDLRGGARAARRFVGWQGFFDFGQASLEHARRIGPRLTTPLFHAARRGSPLTLPQRWLVRQLLWGLPSGQAIATAMRVPVLGASDLDELAAYGAHLEHETPLLYYVLKEARVLEQGVRLGPVGGRIVAEVVLGLLLMDDSSYLVARPDWRPSLPSCSGRAQFQVVDLLRFAGVDPLSRAQ